MLLSYFLQATQYKLAMWTPSFQQLTAKPGECLVFPFMFSATFQSLSFFSTRAPEELLLELLKLQSGSCQPFLSDQN